MSLRSEIVETNKSKRLVLFKKILAAQKYMLCEEALKRAFCFTKAGLKKELLFKVTLNYNRVRIRTGEWNVADRVADSIYLRTIPSFSGSAAENCEEIKQKILEETGKPLGLIVSVVEHFELFEKGSIKPMHWMDQDVAHYHVPIPDFTANVHTDAFIAADEIIDNFIKAGCVVLVHCKASASRGPSVVAPHLSHHGDGTGALPPNSPIESAIEHLAQRRKQVDLSDEKVAKAREALDRINKNDFPAQKENFTVTGFKTFLFSLEMKNGLAQSLALKMMGGYFAKHSDSDRAAHLLEFTQGIWSAKNDDWYVNFLANESSLKAFVNATSTVSDGEKRSELVDIFAEEMDELLRVTFAFTQEKLEEFKQEYLSKSIAPRCSIFGEEKKGKMKLFDGRVAESSREGESQNLNSPTAAGCPIKFNYL